MSGESPSIKICCIQNVEEAMLAVRYGASAIGLVSEMPSGPGVISLDEIAKITRSLPSSLDSFLLTSQREASAIAQQHALCGTTTIQIVDRLVPGAHDELRAMLPGVTIVQVIHVQGEEAVAEADRVAPHVDFILLDSGKRDLPVQELGGTGRTHDWSISRRIRERSKTPVFLAGGLTPDNVATAVGTVRPHGVDVCSGVRTGGKLDQTKLAAFCHNALDVRIM